MTGIIAWLQTSEIAGPLEQLVRVQTVTAVGIAILSLIGIAIGVMALVLLRILWRTLRKLEAQVEQLAPKAEPLLENVTKVAEDAAELSRAVRDETGRLRETIGEVNDQLRAAAKTGEARLRQFGAVLQVVQEEIEDLMLDVASTARGVHTTAVELGRRRPVRPMEPDQSEESD